MAASEPDRREAIRLLVGAAGGALVLALPVQTGCGTGSTPGFRGVKISLSELPPGRRVRVLHDTKPVEVVRDEAGNVTVRSLLCTHQGCEVRWHATTRTYDCPCHQGKFDANGKVLGGAPTRPLPAVAFRIADEAVWIGG